MPAEALTHAPPSTPPRSALITGAAGYIGATLAHALIAEGCAVVGLDDLSHGVAEALPLGVPLVRGDVRDPEALAEALRRLGPVPEVIFHLAGLRGPNSSANAAPDVALAQARRLLSVNAGGTAAVVAAALETGVEAIVLASTAAVLAPITSADERLDETSPTLARTALAQSWLAAEATLDAAVDTGRLSGVTLRLFAVGGAAHGCAEGGSTGPDDIGARLRRARAQHTDPIAGSPVAAPTAAVAPAELCDWIHVEDAVAALIAGARRAIERQRAGQPSHDLYHVGSGVGRSESELEAVIASVLASGTPATPASSDHPLRGRVAETTLMRRQLGVTPNGDLHRIVRDAAAAQRQRERDPAS